MFVTLYDSTAMWKKVIIFNLAKKVTNYIFNCNEPQTLPNVIFCIRLYNSIGNRTNCEGSLRFIMSFGDFAEYI